MRKLKEVLRLHSLGLSQHQIARSCSISQSTVHEYLSAAQAAGVKWPVPENWDDQQIEQTLFPQRPAPGDLAETSGAGLDADPPRAADAQGPDPAAGLAGGPREQPGRLWLQPLLRSLPAVVEEARPGAAPGASRRREDVRRLRRGHDSDSRPGERRGAPRRRVRGGAGRQQLHLRRGHDRAGSAELDRFAYAGLGVFRRRDRGRGAG